MDTRLLDALYAVAHTVPITLVESLAQALQTVTPGAWHDIATTAGARVANPSYRRQVAALIHTWQMGAAHEPPGSIAAALQAAAYTVERERRAQRIELVWTGPTSGRPLRRTAQVLQQLIDETKRELLIVSYAVYDIPEVGAALRRAAPRNVVIRLVIESPQDSAGKVAYDGLAAFGADVAARAEVYRWPLDQRTRDDHGRHGSLHAKCAVADSQVLLISSANLTRYALDLNMELGLLIRGGTQPNAVRTHIEALIQRGVLTRVTQE